MGKINILILDDDVEIHRYYHAVLNPIPGIGKLRCCDGEFEFLQQLRMFTTHIIIADIHMEPKSGTQILREHKCKLAGANIIMLSCSDNIAEESNALVNDGLDVVAYLQKPLQPNDLYEILGYGID